jgi:hypothetical protein
VKTAGNILSALFDDQFLVKAKEYSKLHDSRVKLTAKNGITAAAAHSRIKDLQKGILLIETDHPGWKQILQTKQDKLLNDYQILFPEFDISGISLMLGFSTGESQTSDHKKSTETEIKIEKVKAENQQIDETPVSEMGYYAIKDITFREQLIKLGQTIAESEIQNSD